MHKNRQSRRLKSLIELEHGFIRKEDPSQFNQLSIDDYIKMGQAFNVGVHAENFLLAIEGATPREGACEFSIGAKNSTKVVYNEILKFRDQWIDELEKYLKSMLPPALGKLTKKIRETD